LQFIIFFLGTLMTANRVYNQMIWFVHINLHFM
jgi:hypothetical protein